MLKTVVEDSKKLLVFWKSYGISAQPRVGSLAMLKQQDFKTFGCLVLRLASVNHQCLALINQIR